jgi:hypothetical protein
VDEAVLRGIEEAMPSLGRFITQRLFEAFRVITFNVCLIMRI